MRIVKTRLGEMMPDAKIFLGERQSKRTFYFTSHISCLIHNGPESMRSPFADVDDLTEGKGAEFVDASVTTLVFVSSG